MGSPSKGGSVEPTDSVRSATGYQLLFAAPADLLYSVCPLSYFSLIGMKYQHIVYFSEGESEKPLTGEFLMDSVKNNETKETAVE